MVDISVPVKAAPDVTFTSFSPGAGTGGCAPPRARVDPLAMRLEDRRCWWRWSSLRRRRGAHVTSIGPVTHWRVERRLVTLHSPRVIGSARRRRARAAGKFGVHHARHFGSEGGSQDGSGARGFSRPVARRVHRTSTPTSYRASFTSSPPRAGVHQVRRLRRWVSWCALTVFVAAFFTSLSLGVVAKKF